ncbi:MAG TPA: NAD-dependent epimerase/dehydratase family protein [Candidatus Cloacimonadota bacterium]|nr:NAD-dependent epimerase/dehydratase family protein [Candidatus Cloacimonadota bacterium]HPS38235.1 NAD-dependent epimerase/dehydratase family protein [Candidatus Cloacimonadota bacterium]
MKIAVTGANGFVGSGLLGHFMALGHDPVALIRKGADTSRLTGIEQREVDYRSQDSLLHALGDVDILIHNAGSTKAASYEQMYQSNVALTRDLIQAFNQASLPRQFILISSQAASRPSSGKTPVTEDMPSAPVTWYGKSKQRAEELVRRSCGKAWTILRPCPIYGPGDKDFLELAKIINKGLSLQIGSQDKFLNMIYISELAELITLALDNPKAFGEVFFALDGGVYTQNQVSDLIASALGKNPFHIVIPDQLARIAFSLGEVIGKLKGKPLVVNKQKQNEIMADGWLCSGQKARDILGFAPQADLQTHLKETIAWYKEQHWL